MRRTHLEESRTVVEIEVTKIETQLKDSQRENQLLADELGRCKSELERVTQAHSK